MAAKHQYSCQKNELSTKGKRRRVLNPERTATVSNAAA
jgi:hypothetical protein